MRKKSFLIIALSTFLTIGCNKDDKEPETNTPGGNGSNTGNEIGTFSAQVTGDFEHELTGMAWFEDDGDDQLISFWVNQSEWLSFAFQFNPPIEEGVFTVRAFDPATDREDDEVDATTSNGDYMFFATGGSLEITNVSSAQIDGEFNVYYEFSGNDDVFTINVTGSFSAEED